MNVIAEQVLRKCNFTIKNGEVRMKQFERMTKYIPLMKEDAFGEWVIDHENDGTQERPMRMPFVHYSDMVKGFIQDVYQFKKEHEDYELNRYGEILKKNGIEWGNDSMGKADISTLSGQCIMALIMGAVRAERFCDGALLTFFKDGSILKWLKRLQEIDNM